MNAPRVKPNDGGPHELVAPAPVRRQKKNLLRQHWLTGAFVFMLSGVVMLAGRNFIETEQELKLARQTNAELQAQIDQAKRKKELLDQQLRQARSDEYMELQARKHGYIKPTETMYQQGSGKGQ